MPRDSAITRLAHRGFLIVAPMILAGAVPATVAFAQLSDVKGSKDHPMMSRYTRVRHHRTPLSEVRSGNQGVFELARSQRVEGRVTRVLYLGPLDRSLLEIVRNHELE
jgi:hypothetical protein